MAAVGALVEATFEIDGDAIFVQYDGDGPLVLLCHGFPEIGAVWRPQIELLAANGFTAAAVDMRGHGRSVLPERTEDHSVLRVVGDLVGVARALGAPSFHVVGDDIGALAAWHTALVRPDLVRSVTGISIPFFARGDQPADQSLRLLESDTDTPYLLRFMRGGIEGEMAADPRGWIEGCLASSSGLVPPAQQLNGMVSTTDPVADVFVDGLAPTFVDPSLVDELVDAYTTTGFGGSMAWYRRIIEDWPLLAPWQDATIDVPAMFIGGEVDHTRLFADLAIDALPRTAPKLVGRVQMEGVGHWPHLERPVEVGEMLVGFLTEVDAASA